MNSLIKKPKSKFLRIVKKIFLIVLSIIVVLVIGFFLFTILYTPEISDNYGRVDHKLYVGNSDNQPLIVAFGGSQGGNTWTENYWSEKRNNFLNQGYAVLAIGYANTENTPKIIERISLNAIYDTIKQVSQHPKIDSERIVLLGSSKGGELVLNLASRYDDIDAVIALVPSNVTFPGYTITANTSSWMYNDKEVEFIHLPFFKFLWKKLYAGGNSQVLREIMVEDEKLCEKGEINVENISGPILLLSAKNDEAWPSDYMSNQIVKRLEKNQFEHHYEHVMFEGSHHDTKKHFDVVFKFLDEHFNVDSNKR
ncbi:MAG: acyl-CoA thioester hydrolase/BAAT C-terminal domain-containing protein [Bacteroidota bacterium]